MNSIVYKISSAVATTVLLAAGLTSSAFADTIDISGNGAKSHNEVTVNSESSSSSTQTNHANISNEVTTAQNTGGNNASFNTGGDSSITTGNTHSEVTITNNAGANIAHVDGCGCDNHHDIDVNISGNGAKSHNEVSVENSREFSVHQSNNVTIRNEVETAQNTGVNEASFNTKEEWLKWWNEHHNGNSSINTGDVKSEVTIENKTGANIVH